MKINVEGHAIFIKLIKIVFFLLVSLFYILLIKPNLLIPLSSNPKYNLKYHYTLTNSSYNIFNNIINKKSLLLEYNKFCKKTTDPFYKLNLSKHISNKKKSILSSNFQININHIGKHYLPLYNPLQSIEILQFLCTNYKVNFNCKKACDSQNTIDFNIFDILSINNTTFKKNNEYIHFYKKFQENNNNYSISREYYNSFYRKNLEYLFKNYSINDINTILKEELNNCIYCCCSKTQDKSGSILDNKEFKLEYIHCSSFYEVLHNQLEDIIIKLYIELITEEKIKYSDVYSIYNNLNLDFESQRKLYINNFDSQSFISFLLNYSSLTDLNQNIYQKFLSFIEINKNSFLLYLNSLFDIDSINNLLTFFNINTTPKKKKMSGRQYTSKYNHMFKFRIT